VNVLSTVSQASNTCADQQVLAKLIARQEGKPQKTCLSLPKTVTGWVFSELSGMSGFTMLACPALPASSLLPGPCQAMAKLGKFPR